MTNLWANTIYNALNFVREHIAVWRRKRRQPNQHSIAHSAARFSVPPDKIGERPIQFGQQMLLEQMFILYPFDSVLNGSYSMRSRCAFRVFDLNEPEFLRILRDKIYGP